jgi:hypothetical protein
MLSTRAHTPLIVARHLLDTRPGLLRRLLGGTHHAPTRGADHAHGDFQTAAGTDDEPPCAATAIHQGRAPWPSPLP